MKKMCAWGCGHRVGKRNGDRHAKSQCPPSAGHRGEHHRSKAIARRKRRKDARENAAMGIDQRGAAVKGTSGSKAKTHRAGRKTAQVAVAS